MLASIVFAPLVLPTGSGATERGAAIAALARRAPASATPMPSPTPSARTSVHATPAARAPKLPYSTDVFKGLGAWVDLFDTNLQPVSTVARLKANGVQTLYLETAWSTSARGIAPWSAAWLHAAHAAGIKVVGWYTPNYHDMTRDIRRGAAIAYYSAGGQRFDGLGIDIEIKSGGHWNDRVAHQLAVVRSRVPRRYPIGAIVPPPLQMEVAPHTWAGFPWAQLARSADAFVLMSYWSDRSGCPAIVVHCPYQYTAGNVELTRVLAQRKGILVHIIGGGAANSDASQMDGFIRGAIMSKADGASMYDVNSTPHWQWQYVRALGIHLSRGR